VIELVLMFLAGVLVGGVALEVKRGFRDYDKIETHRISSAVAQAEWEARNE
jgi:hypothetical protein